MNNSERREFAVALAKADTEEAVIRILQKAGHWNDASVWREYGGNSMNYSTIGSQQSSADNALVEKLVNSVDAVLMRECLKREIQPDSDKAPQSIAEAQKEFFGIYNGKLSGIGARERTRLAENILLVATGSRSGPSFSIIDKGEGQSPKRMPETILSLIGSNKIKIPFVQGKFGMGGSGVLRFCSPEHRLLLVISKRNHEIEAGTDDKMFGKDKTRDLWGVTIVRREDPKSGEKSSHYTYLAPQKNILSFNADTLPLLPGAYPVKYENPLESGTFIKLYEYEIGRSLRTLIILDLYYRLALLIPGIGLPIRFVERRSYEGHSPENTFAGLNVRLDEDKKDNLEPEFQTPGTGEITIDNQKLDYSIYVFKKGKKENYARNEGVVFSVNGQAHGFLPKEFFKRKTVGMSYLSDSILVMVDCSKMSRRKQEDLFMSSRDRLAATPIRRSIEKRLEEIIKKHEGLRELQNKRREEAIKDKLQDSKPMADILNNVIRKSPTLSDFFNPGTRIANPFDMKSVSPKQKKFEGAEFPSYFRLAKQYTENKPKHCPINQRFRVQYETDAENNYFDRDKDPGKLMLEIDGENVQDYSLNLWNGLANLTISIPDPDNTKIGDKLRFSTTVRDISQIQPFTDQFYILVEKKSKPGSGPGGKRKDPPDDGNGQGRQKESSLDMPNIIDIEEEDWNKDEYKQFHFNKNSALKVSSAGEGAGYDFYINIDNLYLRREMKSNAQIDSKILEERYRCGMVLLGICMINFEENQRKERKKEDEDDDINEGEPSVEEKVALLTEAVSPCLLPMIASLGSLELDD